MPANVRIEPALDNAGDEACLHLLLEQRQRHAKAVGDDARIDLDGAVGEFDRGHAASAANLRVGGR